MATALPFLPYGRQSIDADDIAAVSEALAGEWLTTGPLVPAFEAAFAKTCQARQAVVCANGTAALHLAYAGLGVGLGDAVVVPAITFVATANAARHAGAEVVFADVDPDSGLMTADGFEAALKRAAMPVEAVAPVHLAGQPADMEAIAAVAARHGIRIVEDACHALASRFTDSHDNTTTIGDNRYSDACCFSFHPVKTIAMGEGGAITTKDAALAGRLRRLRHHGLTAAAESFAHPEHGLGPDGAVNPWYAEMPELGFNYRATDFQCALGLSQLRKLARFAERRRLLWRHYETRLADLAPTVLPLARRTNGDPCWHLAVVLIDFAALGRPRARVIADLKARGIGSQVHYFPVSHQPYYRRRYGLPHLPGAWRYYERCLSLPLFPAMTTDDVDRVVDALADVLALREHAA
ncbi:MAG: UDP-4-amino-4,6-dideoxy-N-acetyl-beta-L-altrosamine transaminase [Alphaproteobacteria bacterium]|nr:MAG: UDP-4-amino-4,6-dideoxy-N-acetyl-beta-L-altrosamine transaminase [Alphaproteobacteria bacterium]